MTRSLQALMLVSAYCIVVPCARAQHIDPLQRSFEYQHYSLEDAHGKQIAQFSKIVSVTSANTLERVLLRDRANRRSVVRVEAGDVDVSRFSFKLIPTNEILSIEEPRHSGVATITLSGKVLVIQDGSNVNKQEADSLISRGSAEFRAALREFTEIGLRHYSGFADHAKYLRAVFFPDMAQAPADAAANVSAKPSVRPLLSNEAKLVSRIEKFIPTTSVRSEFDSEFGEDYYK